MTAPPESVGASAAETGEASRCSEPPRGGHTFLDAESLGVVGDCDSHASVQGSMSLEGGPVTYRFSGVDTSTWCISDPSARVTSVLPNELRLCEYAICTQGGKTVVGCAKGHYSQRDGLDGCCTGDHDDAVLLVVGCKADQQDANVLLELIPRDDVPTRSACWMYTIEYSF
jgi:hypothetical protein